MWRTFPRLAAGLFPLQILLACASAGPGAHEPNVITAPELSRSGAADLYSAIRRLRPEVFRERVPGSVLYFTDRRPIVAVDNELAGGVEVLRAIPSDQVARVEYVSAWQAGRQYGIGSTGGLLLVATQPTQSDLSSR
jgi:hypothetical protein